MHLEGEKCSRVKNSKVFITGMAPGNAYEERLSMFLRENSKNSRSFKCVKNMPYRQKYAVSILILLRYNRNSFLPSVNQTLGIYCYGCVENLQI